MVSGWAAQRGFLFQNKCVLYLLLQHLDPAGSFDYCSLEVRLKSIGNNLPSTEIDAAFYFAAGENTRYYEMKTEKAGIGRLRDSLKTMKALYEHDTEAGYEIVLSTRRNARQGLLQSAVRSYKGRPDTEAKTRVARELRITARDLPNWIPFFRKLDFRSEGEFLDAGLPREDRGDDLDNRIMALIRQPPGSGEEPAHLPFGLTAQDIMDSMLAYVSRSCTQDNPEGRKIYRHDLAERFARLLTRQENITNALFNNKFSVNSEELATLSKKRAEDCFLRMPAKTADPIEPTRE